MIAMFSVGLPPSQTVFMYPTLSFEHSTSLDLSRFRREGATVLPSFLPSFLSQPLDSVRETATNIQRRHDIYHYH